MKKAAVLLVILTIIAGMIFPVFGIGYAEEDKEYNQDSAFQRLSDLINGKYEVKTVPCKKIGTFQRLSDCISAVKRDSEQSTAQ